MIGYIEGSIQHIGPQSIIVNTNGVGYVVFTITTALATYNTGENISFWTHLAVRENSMELFGFTDKEQLSLFTLLLDVSGIGPRGALGIVEIAPVSTLQKAISSGDTSYLTNVSGIGKKTAAKIVIELKDKLAKIVGDGGISLHEESEAMEALCSLGYSKADARSALQQLPKEITSTQQKITESLKVLNS